ncbi:MFS transporter [Rhodobacteraceae bacterium NNCM2]|nr:MFS transporter [Coraliihabitans acroporae]
MVGRFYIENARWLGAGVALTAATSFGQTFFISLFAGHIMQEYGLSHGQWSSIYLIGTLTSAAVLLQAGRLADVLTVRTLTVLIVALYASVAVGMAYNHQVWMLAFLIFGLRFCGQGMMGHIAVTAMARWFDSHRGRAVAFAGLGYALGEAVLPPVTIPLVEWLGWRDTWLVAAGVLVLVVLPLVFWMLIRERTPRHHVEREVRAGLGGRHWTRPEVLRHWLIWAVLPGVITPSFIGTVIFFHQVHVAEVKHWELSTMALAYAFYATTTMISALIAGWAVDRFGAASLLPVYLVPLGIGTSLLGPAGLVESWFAVLMLIGVTTGTANAMWGAFWAECYGTRHLGSIKSLATAAMVFGSAIGPFATGWLIDFGVNFPDQSLWLALWCGLMCAQFTLVLRRLRVERSGTLLSGA